MPGAVPAGAFDERRLPNDAPLGCDVRGAATVAVGQRVGVMGKRAPTNPSPGWIRAP